jgi:hypothetical protein
MGIERTLLQDIEESKRWFTLEKDISTYKSDLAKRIELIHWVLENMKNHAAGNASAGVNKTGSELGKNISKVGGEVVNKTEDVGKKIAGGLGSLLGNASEKLKQGSK